jgi:hypothetical protein
VKILSPFGSNRSAIFTDAKTYELTQRSRNFLYLSATFIKHVFEMTVHSPSFCINLMYIWNLLLLFSSWLFKWIYVLCLVNSDFRIEINKSWTNLKNKHCFVNCRFPSVTTPECPLLTFVDKKLKIFLKWNLNRPKMFFNIILKKFPLSSSSFLCYNNIIN